MSFFTRLKETLMLSWLKGFFTKDNLMQTSTWKGLFRILAAGGIYTAAPTVEDAAVQAILQIIAALFAANGAIDAIRNENKSK
jgi:hypothetical protein